MTHGHWKFLFHDTFDAEFDLLPESVQDELLATAKAVQRLGPEAGRPYVGTLHNPRHPNMKELRFKVNNGAEVWRAAFAFGPDRQPILLAARSKQGKSEQQFYSDLLKLANKRFDEHLRTLQAANIAFLKGGSGNETKEK